MKEVILAVLKKAANRTQVLGDNRMHDLIVDDDFEALAEELSKLYFDRGNQLSFAEWLVDKAFPIKCGYLFKYQQIADQPHTLEEMFKEFSIYMTTP